LDRRIGPQPRSAAHRISQTEFVGGAPKDESGQTGDLESPAKKLEILIIEDNEDYAEGLQTYFELCGHNAVVALTGTEGVSAAFRSAPDAIVCDIGLPWMDGFEVARTLRRNPPTAKTFLVAVTGYGSESDRAESAAAGFDAHLLKPVDPAEMVSLIERNAGSKPEN
jgi:CheY-like chemotaxis protein